MKSLKPLFILQSEDEIAYWESQGYVVKRLAPSVTGIWVMGNPKTPRPSIKDDKEFFAWILAANPTLKK